MFLAYIPGCQSEPAASQAPPPDLAREGQSLFDGQAASADADRAPSGVAGSGGWAIVLAAFRGLDQAAAAQAMLMRIRTEGRLPEAFVEQRGESTVIALGSYPSPTHPAAQSALDRVRAIEIDGQRPYAGAILAPPMDHVAGAIPDYDLRNAKRLHGSWAIYTLQVGVYSPEGDGPPSREGLAEVRRAAEEAAARLRREGIEAFYYHGPNRSMVTVGLFGIEDFDPQVPNFESLRLRQMREAFPHNLLNGRGIRERVPGRARDDEQGWRLQPSALVAVPD